MLETSPSNAFLEYYRCPELYARFKSAGQLSEHPGYFRIGREIVGYGRVAPGFSVTDTPATAADVTAGIQKDGASYVLPFDLTEVIDNLRLERYPEARAHLRAQSGSKRLIRNAYYFIRPFLPVPVRRRLQRFYVKDWTRIPFPRWPVDSSVDDLCEDAVKASLSSNQIDEMPFVWFWPDGYRGCIMMTHDVETKAGRDFCSQLMDLNDSYGVKASFQIVPENRYSVGEDFLQEIRGRGFEINIHGLCHDGHLFDHRDEFLRRVDLINAYGKAYGAFGFRSPVLYRNADWFDALEFSYDMSIPNTAHLDPQHGGCCTLAPYFIGNIVELPLTTAQDYSLFNIVGDFSIDLWRAQMDTIIPKHGLISFLVHPDYILRQRERRVYEHLLAHVAWMARKHNLWIARPGDVAAWWRQRSRLQIVLADGDWRLQGEGREIASIAYAALVEDRIVYRLGLSQSDRGTLTEPGVSHG